MGLGAPSSRNTFCTGTLFLPSERSQPGTPDGVCIDTLYRVDAACAAGCLADLISGIRLSDESRPNAGAASSESFLIDLFGKLHVTTSLPLT